MDSLSMFCSAIEVKLKIGPDMCDITPELENLISESQIQTGNLCATMVGSTGSMTTIEFEPGVVEDLKRAINTLAPPGLEYEHEKAWHDGNGHSHVQAALLGPVRNGKLRRGTWQQVVAINHDNRPRTRTVEVTVIGTKQD
jgi:secondary thiamine-phosphate synthase enzyme